MKLRNFAAGILILTQLLAVEAFAGWELVWSDEFNYSGVPDKTKWDYDVGGSGWGNQELQYYTKEDTANARVGDGVLTITVIKEKVQQNDYSSARLITKNKGDWLYGRFEIAAKLPKGRGLWPAIWMLPTDREYGNWPKSGELDIMENVGFDSMMVHFNIHTEAYNHSIGTNKGASVKLADPHSVFNLYALEWNADSVAFYVNDAHAFTFKNEHKDSKTWPFDRRFHLLLNIAVGGSWGGQKGVDETIFPRSMVVDYVRVYEYRATPVVAGAPLRAKMRSHVTYADNRLRIEPAPPAASVVSIYTADGVSVRSFGGNPMTSEGCSIKLPRGMYVAVVGCGNERRTVRFTAVD